MRKINVRLSGNHIRFPLAVFFLIVGLQGCSIQRFFYHPNQVLYVDPDKVGLKPELVRYPSTNGKMLSALYFKTDLKPKGTVVHFHGNFGNVTNHFPQALFLLKHGYDILAFDYEGYGISEGKPSPENLFQDGLSSIRYAQEKLRDPATGVAAFGQSLGGATAIVVAAQEPRVLAVVSESAFSTHRAIAKYVLKQNWFTWLFSPILPLFTNRSKDPVRYVAKISPRPIFFIHGDADKIIPFEMSETLYQEAKEPKKLWKVPNAGHLEPRQKEKEAYEKAISDFLDQVFIKENTSG